MTSNHRRPRWGTCWAFARFGGIYLSARRGQFPTQKISDMQTKVCAGCRVEKPATEFYKRKKDSHLLVSRCIPCHRLASKAYEKAWYEANAEKKQAANAQWRAENPGKHAEKNRAWNEANREHRNALARERDRHRNLELARSHHAKWRAANKHQVRVNRAAYEATKLQATPAWGDAEKIAEFYFAADFLNMVTGEWHHVDHIVPLRSKRVCGLHAEHNMQVLTAKENLSKGNRRWPDMP